VRGLWVSVVLVLVVAGACGGDDGGADAGSPSTSAPATEATDPAAASTSTVPAGPVTISVRIERRTDDEATADFEAVVRSTLLDPRGWQQAGFVFALDDPGAPYVIVLAEGPEVDGLCLPYDTYGLYSCQNGPVVALNADRWRTATPEWTGDVATYRQMLVNHEVGHLLGRHHPPEPQCPEPGRPALVMSQQSTELGGCLPNPWPLPDEIAAAARHDEPLAPGFDG
jgi:hypothetical protein